MSNLSRLVFCWFLIFPCSGFAQKSPFSILPSQETIVLNPGEGRDLAVRIAVPAKYFIYQEKTSLKIVNARGLEASQPRYPKARERRDPFLNKKALVYEGEVPVTVRLSAPVDATPGERMVEGLLTLQGCSDVLCYPEESHLVSWRVAVAGTSAAGPVREAAPPPRKSIGELLAAQNYQTLFAEAAWLVLLVVFLGGFLTSLTPCILPVIPVTLMIIGVRSDRHWSHNLGISAVLVLGLALMYAGLGMLAVYLGRGLGFVFQQKWVVVTLAVVYFLLALSMFGLFDIHLPQWVRQKLNQVKGHGFWGAFGSGMAVGILAAPCAGPVVGALLLFVAATQSYAQGFGLLWVYALGMGFLFLVLGTGYGILEGRFRRLGFTHWIELLLGLLLLLGSLFYFNTVFPMQKGIDALLAKRAPVVWLESEREGLARARRENKVMIVDFYAEWCPPCKELELGFFRKPEVVALLQQMVPVQIDATFVDDEVERVLKKYNVVGWPTVAFVAPDGRILQELTVVSYQPGVLLERMKLALSNSQ